MQLTAAKLRVYSISLVNMTFTCGALELAGTDTSDAAEFFRISNREDIIPTTPNSEHPLFPPQRNGFYYADLGISAIF